MIELLTNPQAWIAFATLTLLELVLGIDNIIFISILVDKLPKAQREFARRLGLFMAMFMRIGLLLVLAWIVGLVAPLLQRIAGQPFGLPHWGMSFPLAAFTALTLRLMPEGPLAMAGVALLAATSLLIAALALATVRGLRQGSLLVPEAVPIAQAPAP